jgi:hypothetical protein
MPRWVPVAGVFLLIAMQSVGIAQDQSEMRASLQGCLNDAVTPGISIRLGWGCGGPLSCAVPTSRRNRCT